MSKSAKIDVISGLKLWTVSEGEELVEKGITAVIGDFRSLEEK